MNPKIISFGYRCSSAGILKRIGLKTESYPFDWLISRLHVIKDCLQTNYIHFLNTTMYQSAKTHTKHYDDRFPMDVCPETIMFHKRYNALPVPEYHTSPPLCIPNDTFAFPLAMNHHNPLTPTDYGYIQRCVSRLQAFLKSSKMTKLYLYIHPALHEAEFEPNKSKLMEDVLAFQTWIQQTYPHYPRGLVFFPIKTNHPYPITNAMPDFIQCIHDTLHTPDPHIPQCKIYTVHMNRDFVDAGEIFMRNAFIETDAMIQLVKTISNTPLPFPVPVCTPHRIDVPNWNG